MKCCCPSLLRCVMTFPTELDSIASTIGTSCSKSVPFQDPIAATPMGPRALMVLCHLTGGGVTPQVAARAARDDGDERKGAKRRRGCRW